jgi:hypothetical protein
MKYLESVQESMTPNDEKYWFPAKRFGWGWGFPTAWQGWVIFVSYFALIIGGEVFIFPTYGPPFFVAYTGALSVVLIGICCIKGESPHWRWGDK